MRFWIIVGVAVLLLAASYGVRHWAQLDGVALSSPPAGSDASPPADGYTRIISLSPGLTETLFAVGAGDRVVGVTRFCNWPPEAAARPKVGGFLDPNYEAMVALRPDLVVMMPSNRAHLAELERLGLRCRVVDQTMLDDILDSVETLGRLSGNAEKARELRASMQRRIEAVRAKAAPLPHPRVLLSSGRDLRAKKLDEVYIVGRKTFLGDILRIAGGENAFPDSAVDYPALSGEAILRLNPDVIVEFTNGLDELGLTREDAVAPWRALPGLAAAEKGRIATLDGAHLTIPGPRVVETLEALAKAIHPEWDGTP
jgi:iron complex transport system substrate-binding protein